MNALHLQLTGNPGGIASLCYSVAKNSSNNNHMYYLFEGGTVEQSMKKSGIPTHISHTSKYFWKKSKKELIEYCKHNKIEVIINHSNSPIACSHVLYLKRKIPNITVISYLHSNVEDLLKSFKRKIILKPYVKRVQKKSKNIVAISKSVKESAIRILGLNEHDITVVYNGVDCKKFSKYRIEKKSEKLELIFVGRLFKQKGVDILVEAVSKLPSDLPIKLVVVGRGPDQEKLEKYSNDLGVSDVIKFLGLRMDVPELLSKAHFFVHPAIWEEGFGITLIEAMSEGIPCIAFEKGAIPEIIDDGMNGLIVKEVSSDALATAIEKCYRIINSDEYRKMSANASKTGEKFDIKNMVSQLECLY